MYSVRGNETGVNGLAAEQRTLVPSMLLVFIFVFVVLGWDFFFFFEIIALTCILVNVHLDSFQSCVSRFYLFCVCECVYKVNVLFYFTINAT